MPGAENEEREWYDSLPLPPKTREFFVDFEELTYARDGERMAAAVGRHVCRDVAYQALVKHIKDCHRAVRETQRELESLRADLTTMTS